MLRRTAPQAGLLICLLFALVPLMGAFAATAKAAPIWSVVVSSNTAAAPGGQHTFFVDITNLGDVSTDGVTPHTLTVTLPDGMTFVSAEGGDPPYTCSPTVENMVECTQGGVAGRGTVQEIRIVVDVDAGASGVLTARFDMAGGGAAPVESADPVRISDASVGFGIDAFDGEVIADAARNPFTQAGGHPFGLSTAIDFNAATDPAPFIGQLQPVEPVKDIVVDLPPGLVGNPTGVPQCSNEQLSNTVFITPLPLCPSESQVGTATVVQNGQTLGNVLGPLPVFNMEPPPNVAARFGINAIGTVVTLDAEVRTGSDYGLTVRSVNTPEGVAVIGSQLTFWGVPSDASHDYERACPGESGPGAGGPTCTSVAPRKAFFRLPTACTVPGVGLETRLRADSWWHPGEFEEASFISHLPPGYPFAPFDWGRQQGPDGCNRVPFDPRLSAQPIEGTKAGAPSAMTFDIEIEQTDVPEVISQSDLKKAVVTLPVGVRVAPGSADGLQGCSSAQVALRSDVYPSCPEASKLGSVVVDTPLLDEQVTGSIYLATPFDNPFDSLVAVYIVARARGVVLKLPGQVSMDPDTGQITSTFDDNPQLPFSRLHLEFKSGPRAPLTMPRRCGTYTTHAELTGWNGRIVSSDSSFTLTENARGQPCPSTFTPGFSAGTESNSNGRGSSFLLRLTRDDEDQELKRLTVHMPMGLTAKRALVLRCSDADARAGTCPEASRVGSVTVGAGAGSNPFFITNGRAYLTTAYRGASYGLSIVVPAVAGPFDLGTVNVRSAIDVDRKDATLSVVSDPLPTILQGIPLDVRDIRVTIDREGFILNPTSCAEKRIDATIESVEGAVANVSDRFQAADCGSRSVDLRMRLAAGARGRTSRGSSIPFSTTLTMDPRSTNLRFVRVSLPTTINARLPVINRACTRAEFEAGRCDGARVGTAVAQTPLLPDPLRGNVYFVRNGNPLPDMFVALRGEIAFDLVGRVSIPNGKRLRTTFDAVPDVPITSFTLKLVAGRQGPVGAATNLCSRRGRTAKAELDFIGQNGKVKQVDQRMRIRGCGKIGAAKRR